MRLAYTYYDLHDGFIHHWLVAGPQTILASPNELTSLEDRNAFIGKYYREASGITKTPVERGPLNKGLFQVEEFEGSWSYYACEPDHLVDQSTFLRKPHLLRSWAYVQLFCKESQKIILKLQAYGAFDLWLNDQRHFHQIGYSDVLPSNHQVAVDLAKGAHKLLLRWENAGIGPCTHAIAVQINTEGMESNQNDTGFSIQSPNTGIRTRIPTLIRDLKRRRELEKVFQSAYLDREVFVQQDHIAVRWPDDPDSVANMTVRLRSRSVISGLGTGIYGQAEIEGKPGDVLTLGTPVQLPAGPAEIEMFPSILEYYTHNLRLTRRLPIWTTGVQAFSEIPYGDFSSRRREALNWAVSFGRDAHPQPIYQALAQSALRAWDDLNKDVVVGAIRCIDSRDTDGALQLLGALGLVIRFQDQASFPKEIGEAVQDVACLYPYSSPNEIFPEGQGNYLLRLCCELLAGQLYPDEIFPSDGKTGRSHQALAEEAILLMLRSLSGCGMNSWNSGLQLERIITALAHLVDLAQAESIWNLSGVLLDKFFFSLALNTFKGVYGAARSEALTGEVKNGALSATAGITRLMWGLGIFNQHLAGVVSLACNENYELPLILADIACRYPEAMLDKEQQGSNPVLTLTYRTPDYNLSCAPDYYPGQLGEGEHLWQATLGYSAVVFVNHPACSSQEDGRRPNAWRGNHILPRLAQRNDLLIGLYRLPPGDLLGFTHACFPEYAFDEVSYNGIVGADGIRPKDHRQWAFARKGDGYLALMASTGLERVISGLDAYRELRSYGQDTVWLCILGRAALDGDFSKFQEKVLGLSLQINELTVSLKSLRGEDVQFSWEGPFLVDGKEVSFNHTDHFNNLYCQTAYPCQDLVIKTPDYRLRLDFSGLDSQDNLS